MYEEYMPEDEEWMWEKLGDIPDDYDFPINVRGSDDLPEQEDLGDSTDSDEDYWKHSAKEEDILVYLVDIP